MKNTQTILAKYITLSVGATTLPIPIVAAAKQDENNWNQNILLNSDTANTDYFTFRQINENEYAITGLSSLGKTQKILAIPGEYINGKITAIDNNAFANNSILEQIMVSSNILTVGESAFYNCTHLSYVYVPSNNTRFLNYSLDTHTLVDLKLEVPDNYNIKTMFGIDGTQKEASLSYQISSYSSRLYWTDMGDSGMAYTHYYQQINRSNALMDTSAFSEKISHVHHNIKINDSTPTQLSSLWLFFGPIDSAAPQKWYQHIEGNMHSINPDKWTFYRYKYYYANRIVYSLNEPNGKYINNGYFSMSYDSWEDNTTTNWSVCHYDVIVGSNGYVSSSVYEQDAYYGGNSHNTPEPTSVLGYGHNNNYPNNKYVGGW